MEQMNRRGFLAGLGAMVGGVALEQAIPLGRVWSFPKQIKILKDVDEVLYLPPVGGGYFYKIAWITKHGEIIPHVDIISSLRACKV